MTRQSIIFTFTILIIIILLASCVDTNNMVAPDDVIVHSPIPTLNITPTPMTTPQATVPAQQSTVEPSEPIRSPQATILPLKLKVFDDPMDEPSNNGNKVVRYGDSVYFYGPYEQLGDSMYGEYWIYEQRIGESDTRKIVGVPPNEQNNFFIFDNYLYVTTINNFEDYESVIVRISLDTYEKEIIANGRIESVDLDIKRIFYNTYDESGPEGTGFYTMNYDGSMKIKITPLGFGTVKKIGKTIYLDKHYSVKPDMSSGEMDGFIYPDTYDCELYTISEKGTDLSLLTIIPAYSDQDNHLTGSDWIFDMEEIDDWLIMSVGSIQGSGGFFYGSLVRCKKDGSQVERFCDSARNFFINDGWILYYVPIANVTYERSGWYRVRPDGTGKEPVDKHVYIQPYRARAVLDAGGFLDTSSVEADGITYKSLCRYMPDGSVITLFDAKTIPIESDTKEVTCYDGDVAGSYVYYSVDVHGGDTRRGHSCYNAYYRVNINGSIPELLYVRTSLGSNYEPTDFNTHDIFGLGHY